MYKIAYILVVLFLTAGCSAIRPAFRPEQKSIAGKDSDNLSKVVIDQNITKHNFYVQKAQVEIISNSINETFLASIKFLYPDTFLISIRSKTGIEAARIFYTKDTILINDRISRKLLYGKPGIAGRRYGITPESFPLVLGDLISENGNVLYSDCINGEATLNSSFHGSKIRYVLDCENGKVVSATQEGSSKSVLTVLNFKKFIREKDLFYPSSISIVSEEMKLNIRIDKMEYPWNGNIEFIHGKNYELIELL